MCTKTYIADLPGVLSGKYNLRRLCNRGHQASHQLGIPAVTQLESNREREVVSIEGRLRSF